MVLRKPNLLDAFQAAAPEGRQALPGKPPASAAGPFAHERADLVSAPQPAPARRSLWSQMASDRLVQFALAVCVVGISIAYYVGRTGHALDAAQAAGPSTETAGAGTILRENSALGAQTPDPAEANRKTAALSQSVHDAAFLDPKYKFTLRVGQYPNDEAGKKAALADRDYLRGEALPVVQPLVNGRVLILCVGYKESLDELNSMLHFVQNLPGIKGGRKFPFRDAYPDNINHVVARNK
jgi:hypothetical protein